MREWWNWQTHHLEGVAPQGVGVQIPPPAPVSQILAITYGAKIFAALLSLQNGKPVLAPYHLRMVRLWGELEVGYNLLPMTAESWAKVFLPALPTGFTVLGVWGYWGENPLPLLAPNMAFWGVVITFYLFTYLSRPGSRTPYFFAVATALLWGVSAVTGHNLGRFIASADYSGLKSVLSQRDFWYCYVFGVLGAGLPLWKFLEYEPRIAAQVENERAELRGEA